ncbi:MAG TPA: signal peptidase II [Sphingomonadaceae bacterium]|nr:signal peptidase II [Sphingomonadaceae bacterium]
MRFLSRIHFWGLAIAAALFALDQWVKWLMVYPLQLRQQGEIVVTSFFSFRYAENRGVSFGMFPAESLETRLLLIAVTSLISLVVLVWMLREKRFIDVLALAMILGGALGNIWDRLRDGYVTDYLDLHFGGISIFNIFNLADTWITLGVVIILARALFLREKQPQEGHEAHIEGAEKPAETN